MYEPTNLSIYLSGLVTAVAVFRNPNTIPFCLTTDLLLNQQMHLIIQFVNIALSNTYIFQHQGTILRESAKTKEYKPKTLI
jgi:hypothetical protein